MTVTTHPSAEEAAQKAAQSFRAEHHLGSQPIGDLISVIDQTTEFDVAVLDVDQAEHGMAAKSRRSGTVFIAVARTPNPMRQRSSLAHELAHVIFGDWKDGGAVDQRDALEMRADTFARHLLLPETGIRDMLGLQTKLTEADLSSVVQLFRVSPSMAAIALNRFGYISEAQKEAWKRFSTPTLATRHGWKELYQALQTESDQPRAPRRLLARAVEGYEDGVISAQDMATLRGVTVDMVEHELEEAGIFPRTQEAQLTSAASLPSVSPDLSSLDNLDDAEPDQNA